MARPLFVTLLVALAMVTIPASQASASQCAITPPAAFLAFYLPAELGADASAFPRPTPVASWTLLGCWKSRPWLTTCFDVFRDDAGTLYICKACGTTGNPSKGKCRQTTQSELDSGTWCSATQ